MHKRVSRGSGEDGDGRRLVRAGDLKAVIFTESNVRALKEKKAGSAGEAFLPAGP
jgi:hypothetical protein